VGFFESGPQFLIWHPIQDHLPLFKVTNRVAVPTRYVPPELSGLPGVMPGRQDCSPKIRGSVFGRFERPWGDPRLFKHRYNQTRRGNSESLIHAHNSARRVCLLECRFLSTLQVATSNVYAPPSGVTQNDQTKHCALFVELGHNCQSVLPLIGLFLARNDFIRNDLTP